MLVDDLQKVTDEFVTEVNSTLTPKLLWRPFIELVFKDIDTLDLDNKDKVLIGDLEYLKEIALMLTLAEEEELGKENLNFDNFLKLTHYNYAMLNFLQKVMYGGW